MKKGNPELNKERGKLVAKCRKEAGLTQEQFAEAVNLCVETIRAIEQGRRGLTRDNAEIFSHVLNIGADYLLAQTSIKSKKAFIKEADRIGLERPIPIRVLIHLIESLPDCEHVAWECSTKGDKKDWGWHIVVNMKDGRNLYLDSATERNIFNELVSFMDYQLYKLGDDTRAVNIRNMLNNPPESFETAEDFDNAWNERVKHCEDGSDEIISRTNYTGRTSHEIKHNRKEDYQ